MQYLQTKPLYIQCSTSKQIQSRLGLNLFRGEPAISEFDWNFSASHKSSVRVSGHIGSVLHSVSPLLQPAQGQITRFRVYCNVLKIALLRLAFATAPHILLNLARHNNSPVHSAKGTLSPINGLELFVSIRFQYLFHSPPGVLFTFPSRYLYTIGHQRVFSLAGWAPRIPTRLHVPRRTQDTIKSSNHFAYRTITLYC